MQLHNPLTSEFTVTVADAVAAQPVTEYTMTDVPWVSPVTVPVVEPIVPTVVEVLLQVPLAEVLPSVVVLPPPVQIVRLPVMAAGATFTFTVTVPVALHTPVVPVTV